MNRIKEIRKNSGVTQDDLAETLSVSRSVVSKYENGTVPLTDESIALLSKHFGVTADYILCLSDEPNLTEKIVYAPQKNATELSAEEMKIVNLLRETDPEIKRAVTDILTAYIQAISVTVETIVRNRYNAGKKE